MSSSNPEFLPQTKAVIYTRVSGAKQVREGDGLASQETRCREYAKYKNYQVVRVFADDITGKLVDRPAMSELLAFLRQHRKSGEHVVIIDDISRFARNLRAHLELRQTLAAAGGKLESPSIEFGEDSDSILVENLLASVAQHQREKNGEQTMNRMRARMMNGYWVFKPPIGYKYERISGHGKLLVRNEPLASIITEALEGYAIGRFETQVEVKRFLESQAAYPKDERGEIPQERVAEMLSRPVYAGHITHENWGLVLVPGKHKGLVSLNTYLRIQERRNGSAKAPARKDIRDDFPLRGFVECGDCDHPLTACWSTSKTGKKHPYYLCHNKGCASHRKSIPRDQIEAEFETILRELQPSENLFAIVKVMFKSAWGQRLAQAKNANQTLKRDVAKIDASIDQFLDRLVEADNPSVISAYESKIAKLEKQKLILTEKLQNHGKPKHSFEEMFELALQFLSNPWKLWVSGQLPLRKTVLRLAFAERMSYQRNGGFSNPIKSLPFNILGDMSMGKSQMVPQEGTT